MGFEEIPHTADWSVRVWGQDLEQLFVEAAKAMNFLSGVHLEKKTVIQRNFEQTGSDPESLLTAFLSELIYYQEKGNLAFSSFDINLKDHHLTVRMEGSRMASVNKVIKAVTWHNLKISKTERGYETEIVFDV